MFSHFRHSEKTPITSEYLPPTKKTVINSPSPIPFSTPPQALPAPAAPRSISESLGTFIKIIISSASAFLKPSNISSDNIRNRRVVLASRNDFGAAPTQSPVSLTQNGPPPSKVSIGLVVGVAGAAIVVLVGFIGLIVYLMRKKKSSRNVATTEEYANPQKSEPAPSSMEKDLCGSSNGGGYHTPYDQENRDRAMPIVVEMAHVTYSFEELSKATNGFSTDNILGQGGFGQVFKGSINGMEIAVKKLRKEGGQGDKEFRAEVDIISLVHHKNLVSLVGHCIHGDQRLLVFEFVSNKTLDFHLRGNREVTLNWQNRFKIALGAARGLAYLHENCVPKIIHRDIKASNILIDANFEPKVADFGLARFQPTDRTHVSTRIMGTFGYIAPEFATSGRLTDKADVYAFGVVLLEIITGRAPAQQSNSNYMDETLVGWARPLLGRALEDGEYDDLIDPRLGLNYEPYGMARMIECAAAAVRQTPRRRPAMIELLQHLQGEIVADDLHTSMPPGQSSSIIFGAFNSEPRSTDMDSGIRQLPPGSHNYASSEFSGQNSGKSGTNVEPVAR